MNIRIKVLANEAGLPTYNPEGIPTKLERFAELIVLECAEIASTSWRNGCPEVYIKEHFGVE